MITGTWVGPLNDGPTVDTMVQSFAFWGIMDMYRILEEEMGFHIVITPCKQKKEFVTRDIKSHSANRPTTQPQQRQQRRQQ